MRLVNVPVGEPARKGETAPRRNGRLPDLELLKRPVGFKCNTVYEFVLEAFSKRPKSIAMGYRDIKNIYKEKKTIKKKVDGEETEVEKEWLYYELSEYKYETYEQVNKFFHDYGKALKYLGLSSKSKLHIFAATSHKWMKTFLAAQSQSITVVTAYDTLGENGLTHSLLQTDSDAIFTDNVLLANLVNPLQKATSIKFVIHSEPINPKDTRLDGELYKNSQNAIEKLKEIRPDLKFYSLDEVLALGQKEAADITPNPPNASDISCVMYTSGSTGDPKGVVLTHENIVSGIAGVSFIANKKYINEKDRVIAFLPLAHIFELAFELIVFFWGGILGYSNVKTLSDISTRNCQGDMKEFKPTIMVGVAAVWEQIKKGVLLQVKKQPSFTQKLFWAAFYYKQKPWKIPGSGYLIDNIIFKKVKAATGGQLRYVLNGGSPVSKDTQIFITNLLAPMLIGYGLTETVANTTVVSPENFEFGVQGALSGTVTVKLVDVPDTSYKAKNDQGEILIRGPPVFSDYFKNEEETKAAFNEEGWFQTGDIGEWTETGQLRIIDRKKNLIKTLNGEYIALEKLESVYRSNPYVANICCCADDNHAKPVGIVVPNESAIQQLALEEGILSSEKHDVHSILHDKKLNKLVYKSLIATAKAQGLNGIELIQGFYFADDEWTPQNGFVSSAQKLQRKKILDNNKKAIDALYASN